MGKNKRNSLIISYLILGYCHESAFVSVLTVRRKILARGSHYEGCERE